MPGADEYRLALSRSVVGTLSGDLETRVKRASIQAWIFLGLIILSIGGGLYFYAVYSLDLAAEERGKFVTAEAKGQRSILLSQRDRQTRAIRKLLNDETPWRNWSVESIKFAGHRGPVASVAVSGDGKLIASGGSDGTVRLWTAEGKAIGQPLTGHRGSVWSVAVSGDGKLIASGGGKSDRSTAHRASRTG
ncbi:MAG: WD40 repeat domain-containing protein [Alphaproteobacteria bacterium]|nr:WD40 repeat domain-containing protein [Alphaproteobacteria bacterium]